MSNKYCTLLDELGKSKSADHKEVFNIMAERCLLSFLCKRVTLLIPVGKALTALKKLKPDAQRDQLKKHIIGGAFSKAELSPAKRPQVYTKMVIDGTHRIAFKVEGSGASLKIGGVKLGKEMLAMGETRAGEKIPVGAGYEVSELLSGPGEKVELLKRGKKQAAPKAKSVTKAKSKSKSQSGGDPYGVFGTLVGDDVDYLVNMQGHELRWSIVEQYRKSWPVSVFGIDSEYSWHQWAWAGLLSFLRERIPDFYWVYSPYLGLDPFQSIDLIFEHYVKDQYHKYILPDDLVREWTKSKWYMYSDPSLLRDSYMYLAGGGKNTPRPQTGGMYPPITTLDMGLARQSIAVGRENMGEYLKYGQPDKVREGIVKVYKKIYDEPNYLLGETRAIYKEVEKEPFVVGLHNDLRRFLNSRFRYHSDFDGLYPSFLNCSDCGKRHSRSGFLNMFGGDPKKSVAMHAISSILQIDCDSMTIDLDGSDKYRFPVKFLEEFVNSPYFLWTTLLDQPRNRIQSRVTRNELPNFPKATDFVDESVGSLTRQPGFFPYSPPVAPRSGGSQVANDLVDKIMQTGGGGFW